MSAEYATGNRWEKRTADLFEKAGYATWQTRGSKSPADLIAIKVTQVALVQVKRIATDRPADSRIISHGDWNRLYALAEHIGAVPLLADFSGRAGTKATFRLRRLNGTHIARSEFWPALPFALDFADPDEQHHD